MKLDALISCAEFEAKAIEKFLTDNSIPYERNNNWFSLEYKHVIKINELVREIWQKSKRKSARYNNDNTYSTHNCNSTFL